MQYLEFIRQYSSCKATNYELGALKMTYIEHKYFKNIFENEWVDFKKMKYKMNFIQTSFNFCTKNPPQYYLLRTKLNI